MCCSWRCARRPESDTVRPASQQLTRAAQVTGRERRDRWIFLQRILLGNRHHGCSWPATGAPPAILRRRTQHANLGIECLSARPCHPDEPWEAWTDAHHRKGLFEETME
jgi:hypothetical protein